MILGNVSIRSCHNLFKRIKHITIVVNIFFFAIILILILDIAICLLFAHKGTHFISDQGLIALKSYQNECF